MRSRSLTSSRPSINSTKSRSTRVERRCKIINDSNDFCFDGDQDEVQRYSVNGYKVVKISTSLPNCTSKRPQSSSGKKLAYDDWIEKKKSEILEQKKKIAEIELNKKIEEEKLLKEKKEREKRERDNFKSWVEKKKREDLKKKLIAEKEMEIESRLEEIEAKTVVAKELYLKQWCRKKDKELKMQMNEKKLKTQQLEAEQKKRFEESVKAFEKWREKSKKCPKPATQGLLPHQQATPAYVNPVPWVDTTEEEINLS
ncbi:coiled-coil domain-containing protein 34 [Microplitis demolitor]|uniref:coiled-coil domain-containing protein 34 n=1 Tax=Microplitis demolitor TaxID=69319 RepID=UPI0004CD30A2|nr:coiled-coil domain-containing protein 34 [Microplitis demolitor]